MNNFHQSIKVPKIWGVDVLYANFKYLKLSNQSTGGISMIFLIWKRELTNHTFNEYKIVSSKSGVIQNAKCTFQTVGMISVYVYEILWFEYYFIVQVWNCRITFFAKNSIIKY